MAASQLAAILAGSDTNALGLDPAALEANADIQLGQGMQTAGLSTAPAYAPQAGARLADALVGTIVRQQGLSELGHAMSGGIEGMKGIFGEDTLIGKGLRSPSPLVRMMTLQQIPKAITLNSEGFNLEPQQQHFQLGGGNQASATGSAEQAGKVAAARAPFEPGDHAVITTPEGPKEIPITAATRAAMQPSIQRGTSAMPSAAVPQPEPKPPGVPRGTSATPSAAIPQPAETTKDQGRVPAQGAIPGTALTGTPLPNAAIPPAVKADTEELIKDREAAKAGQGDMANVRMIQDFLPKVKTGWSAETKLDGARILKAIGVPEKSIDDFLSTDVAAGQILQKKFVELSAAAARTMGAREPGSVIAMFSKAYPNLGTDPHAVALQTNALYMDRLRAQHLAEQKTNFLNDSINGVQSTGQYRGLKGFNENFNKTNPAENYLHAAEAMSGEGVPWKRITADPQRNAIIRLIPPGTPYLAPDGKMHVRPGTGAAQ
jgi:hypothetical protein